MNAKQIAILIIFCVFMLPLLLKMVVWSFDTNDPAKSAEEGAKIIEEMVVPWWVPIIDKLAGWDTFGSLLIIGLIMFLIWLAK